MSGSHPNPTPPEPADGGPGPDARPALSLVRGTGSHIEHRFRSLVELARELTISLDLHGTSDLVLFNLMGQFSTARAALWLRSDGHDGGLVLVRAHGLPRERMRSLTEELAIGWGGLAIGKKPVCAGAANDLESVGLEGARDAGIELLAPLVARGEAIGVLGLGPRVTGAAYEPSDLEVMTAALGMVGVAIHNARLYNRQVDLNQQLQRSFENLRELDRLKSEFVSNVNHELRTPLTVVIGSLECLRDQSLPPARVASLVASSHTRALELEQLLERLLMFSDVDRTPQVTPIPADDLAGALQRYHSERLPGIRANLREFHLDCPESLPHARFDRSWLYQILDELTNNAMKFAGQKAHIELRARLSERPGERWLCVDVVDDGPGIASSRLGSIFRSFEQGDGSATRRVGGLGLGLALAYELAARMSGKLEVLSTPGHGTTFTLRLRAA